MLRDATASITDARTPGEIARAIPRSTGSGFAWAWITTA
jgi:hypothetical protein